MFAVNIAMLVSCLLAFLGVYVVARRYLDHLTAALPALAYTSWAMRWYEAMGGIMQVFRGSPWEASVSNLDFTASVLALIGSLVALKRRAWWPWLALAIAGLLLTIGMTVHWDAKPVAAPCLKPIAHALWRLGHLLKPSFFTQEMPPPPLDSAIPLPGYLLIALVPLLERGRMVSRYGIVAVTAVCMLAGLAISRIWRVWLRLVLGAAMVFALVPPRFEALPWPPKMHPGFTWLSAHLRPGEGMLNVIAIHPSTMGTVIGGETLLAAHLHKLPTASGSAGVKPRHAVYLETWLATHQHPFLAT